MKQELGQVYSRSIKGISLLTLLLLLLPLVISSAYVISTLIMIGLFTIICTGMNMLMGYAGQISIGHAAFYGIGAYSSAYMTVTLGMPSVVGILVGALVAAVIAYLMGKPTLRLTGHYLALATLGFGVIVFILFKQMKGITGGLDGFTGIPSLQLLGFQFNTDFSYYYLVWILALLGIFLARNVIQSRVGRALRSIHSSEIASDSVGVDIRKYKLQVFIMSAVYAAIAGSLYAHYVSFINPFVFDSHASLNFLIMAVIGGSGSIWGGLVGAAVFVILGEGLKEVIPLIASNTSAQVEIVFFGILLVVLLIYMPEGFGPALQKLWNRFVPLNNGSKKSSRRQSVEIAADDQGKASAQAEGVAVDGKS